MICPRCGAFDQQGDECAACGIVFARWRPREARSAAPPPPPAAPPATRRISNYRFAGALVVALIFIGVIWAATSGPDLGGEQGTGSAGDVARAGAAIGAAAEANEISDDEIKALIEECDFFQERLTVRLPKSVSPGLIGLHDPRLRLAANMGIVEFDPPFDASDAARYLPNPASPGQLSEVRLGPNAPGDAISDLGDAFELDLGRRRVDTLSGVQRSADKIGLFYRWTIEEPDLRYFTPDHDDFMGGAELRRTADGWKARVWRNTPRSALILCEPD